MTSAEYDVKPMLSHWSGIYAYIHTPTTAVKIRRREVSSPTLVRSTLSGEYQFYGTRGYIDLKLNISFRQIPAARSGWPPKCSPHQNGV